MANPNDNLRRLYQNGLKHFSLPDFDTFSQDMKDEEKRRRFYTNMQDAYSLPDFDTFSKDIGAVAVEPVQTTTTTTPQPQQQSTPTTVKPVTDTTVQQASVTSASQPAPAQGWKPSPAQQLEFNRQMDEMQAERQQQRQQFEQRMDDIKKGNRPGAFMGEREFNPQTGKMDTRYYTTQGERVGTQMEQSHKNTEYHHWWEDNTEAGQRSKEQRLQREDERRQQVFDSSLASLWSRHNPQDGLNAAEQAWSVAEERQMSVRNRNAKKHWDSYAAMGGGREMRVVTTSMNRHDDAVAHLTNFDLDRLMNDAWENLGEDGQQALIDDCHQMLRYRNPGTDDLTLYQQAKELARQQSDLRLYNLAVEKNLPQNNLEYLMRKIGDANLLNSISKGLAVSSAGTTGDMAAYEAANEQYRQDGHKIIDVVGTVSGMALDPTMWISGGVGSAATKSAMWAGGRRLAGRGATAAVTNAATRQFATSMTGRVVGGVVGGAANFGTFEGIKEMENQFAHGGVVRTTDENGNLLREGRYVNDGYSAGAVGKQALHGLGMGAAVGWLTPVSGNVADKLVRGGGKIFGKEVGGIASTAGKVGTRAGVYAGATTLEGTIFSIPEWMDGNRDGFDVWTDNMAMMVGFKAKHMIKTAGGVLGDLQKSFESPANGRKNRLDFESRLRQRMDGPSDGGLALTKDEEAELKRYGYDLRELVESAEKTGNVAEGSLIAENAPEIVSRLTDMVYDPRISEAARAKMYYYATGRKLPESTIMRGEMYEDGNGGFVVESQGANGVITSRTFTSRKAADLELERINRQTELNHIEIGERYQQTVDFENRLQEACRTVAEENGWNAVEVYRTCEEARRNHLRGGDKQFDEVQQNILRKVTEAMGEFSETGVTDTMRGSINEKYGVDIDAAIRKEANRRTQAEQTAIDEYLGELIPRRAKDHAVEDAEAENITNQKRLTDEPEPPANEFGEGDPIDPRFDGGEPMPDYDTYQPDGEQKPIGRAVMKYQDRQVEVLSGRVTLTDDGTMIDNERSDNSIVIRDIATDKVEMVSPEAMLSYEEYAPEPVVPDAEQPIAQQPEGAEQTEQSKYTSGQIKIRNSDGSETRGVLTGYVDEEGKHEYYVEGDLQHLHYATESELDNILSDYLPDAPQEPVVPKDSQGNDLAVGDEVVLSAGSTGVVSEIKPDGSVAVNHNGETVTYNEQFGDITATGLRKVVQTPPVEEAPAAPTEAPADPINPTPEPTPVSAQMTEGAVLPNGITAVGSINVPQRDGSTRTFTIGKNAEGENVVLDESGFLWGHDGTGANMQPHRPGSNVPIWTDEQITQFGAVKTPNEQTTTVPITPETVSNPVGNAAPVVENVPEAVSTVEPTPLQRIPRDEKGNPIFEQAESPEAAWDALVEFSEGDAGAAKEIADVMVEEKHKAFEKAQKLKSKGKTPTEILASRKANAAELTNAQAEFEYWQKMAAVEQNRQAAIRTEQEAEARRLAVERAEQEKAEKAAREEAERIERESLEGIPEWHMDTPENARVRGRRRFSGQLFMRQEPVQGVPGKEVEVKFSQDDLPKGRVAVIEAGQLQPSHLQGQRNPMFFIEEAQPKNRSEAVSAFSAQQIAEGIRPEEITGSATAYTGAPTVNTRGEVIQGNNRSDALRYLWENNLSRQQAAYKQYLLDNAEQLGIDPEAVNAMQQPVLVNMLDVDDAEAIRLGQMTAQDTESGGIERIKPKNVAQKLGDSMRQFANMLLRSGDEEASFGQLVDRNGTEVLKWMSQLGAISNTQYQSAFDSKGNLTAEAKNDLQKVLYQAVFKGGSPQLEEMFDRLPVKAQRALLSTAFRDMDSPFAGKLLPEIQASIAAYNQLMLDPVFAEAKKMEEVLRAVEAFKSIIALDDRFEQYSPADNFSNFVLHLAAMYKASDMSQSTIAGYFTQMYDLAQGKKEATLFEESDTTEYPLTDVIKKVLNIDYQPAKNGNNNVANGGADVALLNQVGQGGELRGNEPPASGEQTPAGTEPSDRGAGVADDSAAAGGRGDIQPADERSEGEVDEHGKPFVVADDGTTTFGQITDDSGLTPAPIKLSEGFQDENTGKGYGLMHMEANHGEQIRQAGFSSVQEFVSFVAKNYDIDNIRVGKRREDGSGTFLIQVTDKHENTLFIELSKDGSYWGVNSGGVFRKGYSHKKETVAKTEPQQPNNAVSSDSSLPTDEQSGTSSIEPNGESTVSDRKDSESLSEEQISSSTSSEAASPMTGEESSFATSTKAASPMTVQPSVQASVQAASAEVNLNPTPAQAESGNYKKGHVTIGDFDITIENPAGSIRKGVDADGKSWETTMTNAYGYIKGTESVDVDHIDVFLHTDMDEWNGRKVYVVDQTRPDGSFDEHKVMLGFNDGYDAMRAYLANYDATWAEKHPGLRISEVNIEDFNKWIQSSHRKTKPFADYRNIKALTEEVGQTRTHINDEGVIVDGDGNPMTLYHGTPNDVGSVTDLEAGHQRGKEDGARFNGDGVSFTPDRTVAEDYAHDSNTDWKVFEANVRLSNPYYTVGVAHFTPEEAAEFTAGLKAKGHDGIINYPSVAMREAGAVPNEVIVFENKSIIPIESEVQSMKSEDYSIEARKDTRDNSDIYAVKFEERVSRDEFKGQKAIAKKHGGYWSNFGKKGFLFKSEADAKAFAAEVMGKSEDDIADEAPLSMADISEESPKPDDGDRLIGWDESGPEENPFLNVGVDKTVGQPKPKKRSKWISDEDAAEFDNLRSGLRSHLGEDNPDVVREDIPSYGHKKSQTRNRQDLTTPPAKAEVTSSSLKGLVKLQKVAEKLAVLKKKIDGKTSHRGVISELASAVMADSQGYSTIVTANGNEVHIRISNHNANAEHFEKRGHNDDNVSIVIKSRRTANTFRPHPEVELTEYVYTMEAIKADSNILSQVAESLRQMIETGEYVDLSGKALVNRSPETDIVMENTPSYGKPQPKQMDAEVLRMGTRMTYLMMKGGLRKFSDYAEAMVDEVGDAIRPHLKSLYAAAQNMEEVMQLGWDEEMDDRKTVKSFDVYNFDKPGAKDIIETAQHIVDEQQSQQQTQQLIDTLKDKRNEQRKKEADETSADTEIVVDKAEATASKVESELQGAKSEEEAERLNTELDKEIEEVNKQLALLGYYEADLVEKDFNEAYGYMRNAERKATQDAHRLAMQLAADLGLSLTDPKDKVKKSKPYGFGSKVAKSNIAPAGGEVSITLPLAEDKELSVVLFMEPNAEWLENGKADGKRDDLVFNGGYFRVENPNGKGFNGRYLTSNNDINADVTYDELLADVRRAVRHLLPSEEVRPSAPLTPQPGEDMVKMAERVAKDNEPKKPTIQPEQTMGDLFGGLFNTVEPETPQQTTTSKPKENEKTNVQPRPEETGRGRQQPRPNEPLGESAEHEDERTDGGRVAQRSGEHSVSDTKRSGSVSRPHQGERGVEQPKNTRNNHAERGMDYAPKGEKARIDANIAAIELAKRLLDTGATATPKEKEVLRRYSGWGGLGAAFNEGERWSPNPINKRLRELLTPEEYEAAVMSRNSAYYTPAPVIDAMWDIARALGFKGGNMVEGSAGIGNIIGLMPTDLSQRSNIHAVEIDNTTGGILSLLYPDAKVEVQGFEQTRIPNGSVDLAITNVPFVTGLHVMDESGDSDLSKKFRDIHDFCIAKNVRKLREGGIGIFITSSGTLDKSQKLRNWLVGDKDGNADVVGVFRMHNQTFGGTAATSDIIVVRKRVNGHKSANAIDVSTVSVVRTATYENEKGKTKDLPLLINRYYIEHPEYMGGEMFFGFEQGDTFRPTSMGLFPMRNADQAERIAAWVKGLSAMDWRTEAVSHKAEESAHINEALGENVKEGSMVLDSDNNLCVARMGRAVPLDINTNKIKGRTKQECFSDYSELKNALEEVLKYQTEHDDDAGLQPLLDRLNTAYDSFVGKYGNLNRNVGLAWLRNNDIDYPSIAALETISERGSKDGKKVVSFGKTDIFNRRVVDKESEPAPKNVKDGIIASLYKFGRIDTEYLTEQLGKSDAEVKQEIIESGLGFEDPTTCQMEVSYEYLSGNVREKLRQAKEANESNPSAYDVNIKALEAVVPMNIPAHLIEFTLGSSWVDPKLYERFVKERTELDVTLTNAGGTWHMSEPWNTDRSKNMEMGVRSETLGVFIPGHKLIEAAITNKTITVSKTYRNYDGSTETKTDPAATTACAAKVDEIRQDFKDWARELMQQDPEMSMHMEEIYNEQFNNSVPKSIPDEFIPEHFGGAATMVGGKPFHLRPHQAKAVIRATTQPVLLAHEVGTGKTYTLITTAMEMRRLGTARKPMIVVQNATVGQFVASAKALYPNAKVLTLEDADRNAEGRRAFYAKIKFNDWDMIVVPQSVFERIPESVERQTKFIQDKIEEKMLVLEQMKEADPDGKSMIVRQAEKEIERLNDEIAQIVSGETPVPKSGKKKDAKKAAVTRQNAEVKAREMLDRETDDVEDFDSMGIDAILVDEAHEYKHLGFATAMQRGVKGVDPSYSKKSQGVFLKTQAVLEKTGGKNVVFATGTPISNTAAEIWTFMRYLMPADVMKDYGIYYFDDFVRNFGNLQQMLEFSTSGKYKENNRFAGYVNLPELVRIWSTVADTVLTREAGGVSDKIPQMEGDKAQDIFLPQTRALRAIMKYVKAELDAYDKMSGKEKKENRHIPLVMYGIAKAAAVDARLVQADAEDDPNSKTNEAVRQTMRSLEDTKEYKGTVAIFADNYQNKATGFNLYEDISNKLIEDGVPEEQIVVMKSNMTVKKKLEIFDKVNSGEVRVIMGSTFTLGTGVNIQERLHTLIHLDAPNRPMDYTQRNGRILRQGNLHRDWNLPVRVLRFGVEDSLDVTAYQRLKTKGAIADSIMNGKNLMENSMESRSLEEEQDLFGDITAQLSGSEYALLKNQIEKEVRKLTAKLKSWEADQTYIHNRKRQIAGQNKEAEKRIAENKGYLERVAAATIGDITVGRLSFPSIDAMEDFFSEQNKKKREAQEQVRTAGYGGRSTTMDITLNIGGFDFKVHTEIKQEMKQGQGTLFASAPTKMTYSCHELGIDAMSVRENLIKNAVAEIMEDVISGKDFRERIEAAERAIERNNAELKSMEARDGVPFQHSDELAQAEAKLEEYEGLMKKEMEEKEAKYADMDKDVEAASGVEYSEEDEGESSTNEPETSYNSNRNRNFANSYGTKDGETIKFSSENPEAYGVPEAKNGTDNSRTGAADLQRQGGSGLEARNNRLNTENGEFSLVERVFTETGSFNFTSGERIESADDVAFIFSALEDKAKEHSFVVLVKDGKPTVVELGMGSFNATMVDIPTAALAYDRIRPDEVYFVHNHPSGNLKCSPQDVQILKKFEDMCDVPVQGVIINLKTGHYGTFDTSGGYGIGSKRTPESASPLTVHTLDKQIFAADYDPMMQPQVRSSQDVAAFLNSHRMGDRAKVSFLILSRANKIVGNIHTPYTNIPTDADEMARYISERVIQFGGESAILYGDFAIDHSESGAYNKLKQSLQRVGDTRLLDVVTVEGNHTKSANDEGMLFEPGSEYGASANSDIRFREVEDDKVLTEFAEGKTVKAYRPMQVIDGKLYSPMATKVGGKTTPEIKLGVPEQSEEHPEIIKGTKIGKDGVEQGYVVIDKGLGKGTLTVAYNPYAHTSRTVLNDQFSSAYIRPNLVTVEVEVPESELRSGYRAHMAKDAVGEISWHSGSVSGQLTELGKPRRVILTRYDKPVRIVPFKEVAEMIAAQLDGTDIAIPYNVVQPQLRAELERLGVAIIEEASGSVSDAQEFGKAEYITDQEIERINAHQQEMAQTAPEAKSVHAEKLSKKFNTPIRIVEDPTELTHDDPEMQKRMRGSKGFYNPVTGEVVVVVPNNVTVEDVAETVFHEVVAHKGLREIIGEENYDAFCDEVYDHLKDDLKQQIDEETTRRFVNEPGKSYEHHRRVAVDEMFGRMSEKGFEDFTKAERGIWGKLKAKVLEAINKFLGSLKLPKWVKLGDNELRYMLWRSHEKLRGKGDYVTTARDVAKRNELGLTTELRFKDGETGDIWKDRSVGLEERITNAAIRLANNQAADLTLRNDAMRAVTNNLQSLLHSMRNRRGTTQSFAGADRKVEAGVVDAMNAQAMYDRSTVKRVADLARILMQHGYLSGMTSGEMQRLLSAVKNATAMHDTAEYVQKIMDIMVDNQLRNGEATLRNLLAIRGSKVDARGVEVQGALDVVGQKTMEVVKKAMSLTEDDINDRIAEALNRMSDPAQTIADQAVIEYAGLNMALDYVQNISNSKAEEKTLRDSLKTAKEDRDAGRMTDAAYKQYVETTEDAIRKNKIERAEAYFNLVGRLSDSLRGSIENAKAFREAEKARVNEIHHNANSDMEGRPTNEHHRDDWKDKVANNGFVQFLFSPLATFDQVMRVFGNKSANGEGYLWNRFMRGWVVARNKELTGVKEKFAQLDEKAAELFGKGKTWGDIIRMESKLPKATVSFWDGGEMRDHELTQGNLLYIYMVDKMTDGRMKLRRMGITEQDITNIENFLDPRFKTLGDWLQDEFLVATRNEYNETHKRMFGASMAAIENYFPLKILANARIDKEEDVNQPNRPDGITTKTGSIIKRRVNNLALDITGADALSVILDHITQMEHWNAYAEWNRDLNTLRTYKRFRNQVINMTTVYGGGRKLWENFNDLCLMSAGEYRPPIAKLDKSAVNIAKGVTAAKVSFRMFTALKQLLSAPAYAPEVSIRSIAKSIANPYGDFKWCMENLPIFRERWHSRISGDPRLLKNDKDWNMWRSRVMEICSRIGMTPNAFVDAVTVSIGARAMYETRLKQYLREGYPADAAEERAKQDAAILFNQTQQSSESPFLSTMQVDRSWLSVLFTVFRNSAMSYTRQEFDAMRNLKRNLTPGQQAKSVEFMTKQILRDWNIDPDTATDNERNKAENAAQKRFRRQVKKDVIRVATFGFILEMAWNLGAYLPYIIFGNDEDEKGKMWDDALTHAYFGSVEGLTGGDVLSSFGNMAASGEWSFNQLTKDMPMASDINNIANKFIAGKNAEAINDIIFLVVQSGIGMNPQSITDTAVAIMDACGDDPALCHEAAIFVMRVLQVPQSQIDKMYFDEIGLSGEEASKLTPTQLAQRYAEYKVKRGTPLAPWSWDDDERTDRYLKSAEKKMKERLESQGDADVIETYNDMEARYNAVSDNVKEAKELMKTDYAAAAQAHAAVQQDPDFGLYQQFGSLDKQLARISKMWLSAKTPEEATLVSSTIPAYRAGMVKALQAETAEAQQSAMSELTTLMNEFYAKYQAMQPTPKQPNR